MTWWIMAVSGFLAGWVMLAALYLLARLGAPRVTEEWKREGAR